MHFDSCLGSVSRVGSWYIVGDLSLLGRGLASSRFGVAGSRRGLSRSSVDWVHSRIDSLDPARHVLVSGLAIGADAVAHRRALARGIPQIAVLPSGFDRVYPRQHLDLAKSILASGGCLVSLLPPDCSPYPGSFVDRNKVIALLSHMLLVPQCAPSSGTMHTVRFSLSKGRHVLFNESGAPHLSGVVGCSPI